MTSPYPPLSETLHHEAPMVLLEHILFSDGTRTECSVSIHRHSPFVEADGLPCLVTIEYMAQCIGVGAGLKANAQGNPPPPGMLVGSREMTFYRHSIPFGAKLTVIAKENLSVSGFGHFFCEVRLGEEIVSAGVLSVASFHPKEIDSHGT